MPLKCLRVIAPTVSTIDTKVLAVRNRMACVHTSLVDIAADRKQSHAESSHFAGRARVLHSIDREDAIQ